MAGGASGGVPAREAAWAAAQGRLGRREWRRGRSERRRGGGGARAGLGGIERGRSPAAAWLWLAAEYWGLQRSAHWRGGSRGLESSHVIDDRLDVLLAHVPGVHHVQDGAAPHVLHHDPELCPRHVRA
eukprot:scaffold20696_cov112-Isochrysis_galbana.AAC.3